MRILIKKYPDSFARVVCHEFNKDASVAWHIFMRFRDVELCYVRLRNDIMTSLFPPQETQHKFCLTFRGTRTQKWKENCFWRYSCGE